MIKKILNGLLILFSIAVILNVILYSSFSKEVALLASKSQALKNSIFYMSMFYSHIFLGAVALTTGVTQLVFTLRKMKSHRIIGKTYMVAVLVSGTSGLYIAYYASTGLIAQLGFSLLAILWLFTSYKAYYYIRQKMIAEHQKWIMRSMALTFAAITLRILMPSFLIGGIPFDTAYPIIAWACWVPNLMLNELVFRYNPSAVSVT